MRASPSRTVHVASSRASAAELWRAACRASIAVFCGAEASAPAVGLGVEAGVGGVGSARFCVGGADGSGTGSAAVGTTGATATGAGMETGSGWSMAGLLRITGGASGASSAGGAGTATGEALVPVGMPSYLRRFRSCSKGENAGLAGLEVGTGGRGSATGAELAARRAGAAAASLVTPALMPLRTSSSGSRRRR